MMKSINYRQIQSLIRASLSDYKQPLECCWEEQRSCIEELLGPHAPIPSTALLCAAAQDCPRAPVMGWHCSQHCAQHCAQHLGVATTQCMGSQEDQGTPAEAACVHSRAVRQRCRWSSVTRWTGSSSHSSPCTATALQHASMDPHADNGAARRAGSPSCRPQHSEHSVPHVPVVTQLLELPCMVPIRWLQAVQCRAAPSLS